MIDATTGGISIRNVEVVIGPSLTRATFLASSIGQHSQISVENEPYCSFNANIPACDLMSLPACLTLFFYHQQLDSVSIVASDERFGASWSDWSETKEFERKRFHDQWLTDTIGTTNTHLSWGKLSSNFDAKSGFSSIHVRYSWQGKPWKPATTTAKKEKGQALFIDTLACLGYHLPITTNVLWRI
jgi:hypothetical protein